MAAGVDGAGLKELQARLLSIARAFPAKRTALLEEVGGAILAGVRRNIGGTGKVQSWQDRFLGSRGGYAAVRAKAKTWQTTKSGRRYAVGYITNAIEHGHWMRRGAGSGRHVVGRVAGRYFYQAAEREAEQLAGAAADRLLAELQKEIEGG